MFSVTQTYPHLDALRILFSLAALKLKSLRNGRVFLSFLHQFQKALLCLSLAFTLLTQAPCRPSI